MQRYLEPNPELDNPTVPSPTGVECALDPPSAAFSVVEGRPQNAKHQGVWVSVHRRAQTGLHYVLDALGPKPAQPPASF